MVVVVVVVVVIVVVVVVVTLFIQGGPFSYEAGIHRGPINKIYAVHAFIVGVCLIV